MKKLISVFFAGLAFLSCVNEEYDFTKIDGTAVIAKDLALPIGSLEKINVSDIVTIDESEQMVIKEDDGDYAFHFADNNPIVAKLSVPSFSLPLEDASISTDYSFSMSTGSLAGMPTPNVDKIFRLENQSVEKIFKVTESHMFPYEIRDLKKVTMEMLIEYRFTTLSGACYIAEGFMMDFPDWMTLVHVDDHDDYVIENQGDNKNIVHFIRDVRITADTPYIIDIMLTGIDIPDGCIVPGGYDEEGRQCMTLAFDEANTVNKIVVTGGLYANIKDFPIIPNEVGLNMHLEFSNFKVSTALVKLDLAIPAPDTKIAIAEYPEFFANDDMVIDIYDPQLMFNLHNEFPLTISMYADVSGYKNGKEVVKMHFGDGGESDSMAQMIIPGLWEGTLMFSRQGNDGAVRLPKIGDLLIAKPDEIRISNVMIRSTDEYVTIEEGKELIASTTYELYAPLAFGSEFRFTYDMALEDLGLDLTEAGVKSASLILNVENSLPLNFNIVAQALATDGSSARGLALEVLGEVASGTQNNPVTSPVEIRMNSLEEGIELNSLKLKLTATCPSAAHQGIPLNEAQGLKISDVALRLPDGVNVDVTAIFKADPSQEEGNI